MTTDASNASTGVVFARAKPTVIHVLVHFATLNAATVPHPDDESRSCQKA
jgi:hypothetical protein